jgi:hypothetical protein
MKIEKTGIRENGASAVMQHLKDIRTISTAWFPHWVNL